MKKIILIILLGLILTGCKVEYVSTAERLCGKGNVKFYGGENDIECFEPNR